MKNLKKVLSLVLVLVMACGLFATASAAEYVDAADIKYAEAVDVMSGIGIIEGVGGDKFAPNSPVTRAAAAKIIAYLLLGKETADGLAKNATQFTDVPAGHWAAGYVQFCANEGIINGKSATVFAPDEGVTTIGFAKLLLGALGYGTKDEFVGEGWEKSVTKYAAQAKIFAGNYAANPDAVATRDEAALYAFNALKADKVAYSALLGDYLSGSILGDGQNYGTFAQDYNLFKSDAYVVTYVGNQFMLNDIAVAADEADLGRKASVWYQVVAGKKVAVTDIVYADAVIATKYNAVDEATAAGFGWAEYSLTNPNFVALADTSVAYYYNGLATTGNAVKGDKIEFVDYDANGKVDAVLVTTYTAADIIAPVAVNPVTGNVTIAGIVSDKAAALVEYPELAMFDVVYYTTNAVTNKTTIAKAVVVAGQKTAYTAAAGLMVFGGAAYTTSGIAGTTAVLADIPFNSDYALYLDAAGNVIKAVSTAAIVAPNYVVLEDSAFVTGQGLSAVNYYEAKILKLDGTTEIIKVADIDNSQTTGVWYNLTKNLFGQDVLVAVTGVISEDAIALTTGKVAFGSAIANNATTYIVKSGAFPFYAYNVYTGYAAVPTSADADIEVINNIAGIAQYVFVDVTGDASFGATVNYAFVAGLVPTTYQTGTVKYDAYKAVVGGKADVLNVMWTGSTAPAFAGTLGLYAVEYDVNGYATLTGSFGTNYGATTIVANNGTAFIGTDKYAYNANTVVYLINALTGAVVTTTVEAAALTQNIASVSVVTGIGTAVAAQTIAELYVVA